MLWAGLPIHISLWLNWSSFRHGAEGTQTKRVKKPNLKIQTKELITDGASDSDTVGAVTPQNGADEPNLKGDRKM